MDAGLIHAWINERKTRKPDKTSVQLISLFICLHCIVLYWYLLNLLWATQVNCHKYLFVKASRSKCTCSIALWKLDFCMLLQANSCQHVIKWVLSQCQLCHVGTWLYWHCVPVKVWHAGTPLDCHLVLWAPDKEWKGRLKITIKIRIKTCSWT